MHIKNIIFLSLLLFAHFGLWAECASVDKSLNLTYADSSKYSFPITIDVENLVRMLRRDLSFPVNFESEILSYPKDTLSASVLYAELSQKPESQLRDIDKVRMCEAKKIIDENKGNLIIDYRRRYLTLERADLRSFAKLKSKIESTGIYTALISDSSILIYPKDSVYKNVTIVCALARLVKIGIDAKPDMSFLPIFNNTPQNIFADAQNEDFRIFLSRLCSKSNPQMQWQINGYKSGRSISFSFVRDKTAE